MIVQDKQSALSGRIVRPSGGSRTDVVAAQNAGLSVAHVVLPVRMHGRASDVMNSVPSSKLVGCED